MPDPIRKVYDLEFLSILNEIKQPIWVVDMNPETHRIHWGNATLLQQVFVRAQSP